MQRTSIAILLIALNCLSHAAQTSIKLGDKRVVIQVINQGRGNNFVHLHNNETTALRAAKSVLRSCGGTLISLRHPGRRNISFRLNKKKYVFDPNRIFTNRGIRRTLTQLSRYDKQAAAEVGKLARKIRQLIPGGGKVVAVHNNSGYSMKNYYPKGSMRNDAKRIFKAPKRYYRNFYFVTSASNFNKFKKLGFNVVLQNNASVTDDGSLSVAMRHRNYINVEAGYGQLSEQINMLKATCN